MNNKFEYRIKSTGRSAQELGNCELCQKHVSEVFYQVEYWVKPTAQKPQGAKLFNSSLFGHQQCLLNNRKV
jgi:hypothetical protein